ncbi:uncharacterized protein LOC127258105 [Andrographis paniculata]|uniref:uncharacterized protein LOC127258105 n=1 Tax=Andrographis paniculata TaxID=175694 RepID=UPI0021E94905|nr:uncharacterized protein LOC127258105 [Andrographis paniculata]XP_051140716.1 uncharacterized protein LOC127258105 [Andrographis paniculata]
MAEVEDQINARPEAAGPPHGELIGAAVNHMPEDSNQSRPSDRSASPSSPKIRAAADPTSNGNKAKSCKGCLYYSSQFKSSARNPLCVGLTRSLPTVPPYIVGQSEMEASKDGRGLSDFRYACVGYSLYMDRKGQAADGKKAQNELPVCVGLEVLVDRSVHSIEPESTPAHMHHKEDSSGLPQPQRRLPKPSPATPKPSTSSGNPFLTRFARNAKLVANEVAKNIERAGNQIKQSLDDILYPYRRRPK